MSRWVKFVQGTWSAAAITHSKHITRRIVDDYVSIPRPRLHVCCSRWIPSEFVCSVDVLLRIVEIWKVGAVSLPVIVSIPDRITPTPRGPTRVVHQPLARAHEEGVRPRDRQIVQPPGFRVAPRRLHDARPAIRAVHLEPLVPIARRDPAALLGGERVLGRSRDQLAGEQQAHQHRVGVDQHIRC